MHKRRKEFKRLWYLIAKWWIFYILIGGLKHWRLIEIGILWKGILEIKIRFGGLKQLRLIEIGIL